MRICLDIERDDDCVDNCAHLCTVCGRLACEKYWEKVLLGAYLRTHIKKQHGKQQLNISSPSLEPLMSSVHVRLTKQLSGWDGRNNLSLSKQWKNYKQSVFFLNYIDPKAIIACKYLPMFPFKNISNEELISLSLLRVLFWNL